MVRVLDRRTFLRGAGGLSVGLPLLDAMIDPRRAYGGGPEVPMRLIVFFSNNGTYHPNYTPTGGERDFTLSPILQPLAPFRERLIVTSGIDMEVSYHGADPGNPHAWIGSILSGALAEVNPVTTYLTSGGQTLDQFLGEQVGQETRFPTFEFGVQAQQYSGNPESHLSYAGAAQPIDREDDPQAVFDRLFSDFDEDPAVAAERRARRQLVIDAVKEDMDSLKVKLGNTDRLRVEEHLESIRDIEQQLQTGELGKGCGIPDIGNPAAGSLYDNDSYPAMGNAMMDMMAASLACDLTRVSTLQWDSALGTQTFSWLGHTEQWHEISHKGESDTQGNQQKTEVNTWYAQQMHDLAARLDAIPEGDGSVLDNTLIVWVNELGRGNAHNRLDMPFVLLGDAQGYFDTGRYLAYNNAPHNNLLVSIANAMGVDIQTFGEAAYCTGPLAGLTG